MTLSAAYTVTLPPLGSLVRGGFLRLAHREPSRSWMGPIGEVELVGETWHRASDRLSGPPPWLRTHRGWSAYTLCGRRLLVDPEDGPSEYVRSVIATVEFPSGAVCSRCSDSWRRISSELAAELIS